MQTATLLLADDICMIISTSSSRRLEGLCPSSVNVDASKPKVATCSCAHIKANIDMKG